MTRGKCTRFSTQREGPGMCRPIWLVRNKKRSNINKKKKKTRFQNRGIKLIKIPPTLGVRFNIYLAVFPRYFQGRLLLPKNMIDLENDSRSGDVVLGILK